MEPTLSMQFLMLLWVVWSGVLCCLAFARIVKWIFGKEDASPVLGSGVLPFKSREEFLKARMEMDLGEFLDRAFITPAEITRLKPSKVDNQSARDRLEALRRRVMEDFSKGQSPVISAPPGGAAGFGGSGGTGQMGWGSVGGAGSSGVAGTAYQGGEVFDVVNNVINKFSSGLNKAIELKAEGFEIKVGCWYRVRWNGELVICKESFGTAGYFVRESGVVFAHQGCEIDIAIPRIGETWTLRPCHAHPGGLGMNFKTDSRSICVQPEHAAAWRKFSLCGCSVPFEFGHGKI